MTQVVVFDMDDTLYPERSFVISGFREVSCYVQKMFGISGFFETACSLFEQGRRGQIFNAALERMDIPFSADTIMHLVEIYRSHFPAISLYPDAERALKQLAGIYRLALVTDGPAQAQEVKLQALQLKGVFDPCIVTDRRGAGWAKPFKKAFLEIQNQFEVCGADCVYIGDNPDKDFIAPKALGWLTVCVRREDGIYRDHMPGSDLARPSHEIHSLDQLWQFLGRCCINRI